VKDKELKLMNNITKVLGYSLFKYQFDNCISQTFDY